MMIACQIAEWMNAIETEFDKIGGLLSKSNEGDLFSELDRICRWMERFRKSLEANGKQDNCIVWVSGWLNLRPIYKAWCRWENDFRSLIPKLQEPTAMKSLADTFRSFQHQLHRTDPISPETIDTQRMTAPVIGLFGALAQICEETRQLSRNSPNFQTFESLYRSVLAARKAFEQVPYPKSEPSEFRVWGTLWYAVCNDDSTGWQDDELQHTDLDFLDTLQCLRRLRSEFSDELNLSISGLDVSNKYVESILLLGSILFEQLDRIRRPPNGVLSCSDVLDLMNKMLLATGMKCCLIPEQESRSEFIYSWNDHSPMIRSGFSLDQNGKMSNLITVRQRISYAPSPELTLLDTLRSMQALSRDVSPNLFAYCGLAIQGLEKHKTIANWIQHWSQTPGEYKSDGESPLYLLSAISQYLSLVESRLIPIDSGAQWVAEYRDALIGCEIQLVPSPSERNEERVIRSVQIESTHQNSSDSRGSVVLYRKGYELHYRDLSFPAPLLAVIDRPLTSTERVWQSVQSLVCELNLRVPGHDVTRLLGELELESLFREKNASTLTDALNQLLELEKSVDAIPLELLREIRRQITLKALAAGIEFWPRMNARGDSPLAIAQQPIHAVQCNWGVSPNEPVGVTLVQHFSLERGKAIVWETCGDEFQDLCRLLAMSPSDCSKECSAIRDVIRLVDRTCTDAMARLRKYLELLRRKDEIDPIMKGVHSRGFDQSDPDWQWIQWLLSQNIVPMRIYPSVSIESNQVSWKPLDAQVPSAAKVTWIVHHLPLGTAVQVRNFSLDPKLLEADFSLGPQPGEELQCVARLFELSKAIKPESETQPNRKSMVKRLQLLAESYRLWSIGAKSSESYESVFGFVQDCILDISSVEVSDTQKDEILELLRGVSGPLGLTVLPENWSFSAGAREGFTKKFFDPDSASMNSVELGWRVDQQRCPIPSSAPKEPIHYVGKAPTGWQALLDYSERLPQPSNELLKRSLLSWPKHFDSLESQFGIVFQEWYDNYISVVDDKELVGKINDAMVEICEALGCGLIWPELHSIVNSSESRIQRTAKTNSHGEFSRVNKVLAPGLRGKKGKILVLAKVEAIESTS